MYSVLAVEVVGLQSVNPKTLQAKEDLPRVLVRTAPDFNLDIIFWATWSTLKSRGSSVDTATCNGLDGWRSVTSGYKRLAAYKPALEPTTSRLLRVPGRLFAAGA